MSAVLSNAAQEAESVIADLLVRYEVGTLKRHTLATNGIENLNYLLDVERQDGAARRYVMTFLQQAPNAGDAYVPMMDALVDAGLPVPAPLRTSDGEPQQVHNGTTVLLQRLLPGRHTVNPTLRQLHSLGVFIGRMHRTLQQSLQAGDLVLPAYPRDLDWLTEHTDTLAGQLPFNHGALMRDTLARVASLLGRGDTAALPTGMIHGDLFRDNALFNEQALTGVLDFHHASQGWLIYDLAVAATDWCTDNSGALDRDRMTALLRAYHQVRPLRPEELWLFPVIALYAALAFWISRLLTWLPARGNTGARTKNPDEYRLIVAHLSRHQFYLDPRLLS